MTIAAYHWVSGGAKAVERILQAGAIEPAASRTGVRRGMSLCQNVFEDYGMIQPDGDLGRIRKAFRIALEQLLKDPRRGPVPETNLGCVDLLAGDADRVFLSTNDWYQHREPNGFIFDAEDLILRGAAVRLADLVDRYTDAVDLLIYNHRGSAESLAKALLKRLEVIRRDQELSGADAVEALRTGADLELIWDGPLPIKVAWEIWRDGEPSRP